MQRTKEDFQAEIDKVSFRDWRFCLREDTGGRLFLQIEFDAPDAITGEPDVQKSRKWYLSPHMVTTEIVGTCLLAVKTAMEHEVREEFRFHGVAPYNTHVDIFALMGVADQVETRDPVEAKA